jgi:membrane-associated phospholipid phosphatase
MPVSNGNHPNINQQVNNDADSRKSWKALLPIFSLKFLLLSLLFLGALLSFGYIVDEAVLETENRFDREVFELLAAYSTAEMVSVMASISFFGSSAFLFPAYAVITAFFLFRKRVRPAINIVVVALSSTAVLHLLKRVFRRERPESPLIESLSTYSFPSGHSVSSFIFSIIFIYLIWKTSLHRVLKWIGSVLLLLFSFTIGLSRIILKMHYPSDVVAGFCLGLIWVLLSFWLLRRIEKKSESIKKEEKAIV